VSDLPRPDPEREKELVAAANRGDASAFEELYRSHRRWVLRLALRHTGREEDALDVLQEAFVYLLGKLPGLELSGRLTTLLYPVVVHASAAARRRSGRFRSDEEALEGARASAEGPGPGGREDLVRVLRGLPEAQREVLLLRFSDGLSLEEVATALDLPVGTVKSRIHYALAALREDPRTRRYFEIEGP